MKQLSAHRVPREAFTQLARGTGDRDCLQYLLAGQRSKHTILLTKVRDGSRLIGHQQADWVQRAYLELADIQAIDGPSVDAVICYPAVAGWAARTIQLLADPGTAATANPGQLASIAAAAAIRAGIERTLQLRLINGSVMLPSVGRITSGTQADEIATITIRGGEATATGDGWTVRIPADPRIAAEGWQGLHRLVARSADLTINVLIDDLDEDRMPGYPNLAGHLSLADLDRWRSALLAGWDLLATNHRQLATGASEIVRVLTPLTAPSGRAVSATSSQAFGAVALSEPADGYALATTLVHEVQHAKLSALMDLGALTLPDDGARYYVRWRDDPRPLAGVLHGTYAFLGVAAFWRQQRAAEEGGLADLAQGEYASWHAAVREAAATLQASGKLTTAGDALVAGMTETLRSWQDDVIPASAVVAAETAAIEHRASWDGRYVPAARPIMDSPADG
jgi:HEXXH motif-containing protein